MERFGGLKEYQEFMDSEIEEEIEEFYKGPYQKPVLGSKAFIEKIRENSGAGPEWRKASRNRGNSLG